MPKSRMLVGACFAAAALVWSAMSAQAGIPEYNAAVAAGDFKTAASEAETIWKTYDKTRADTAIVAREFAWTSMRADQPERARVFAAFLVEEGGRLPTPDDDPLMAKVLLEWTHLGDGTSVERRGNLSAALSAWSENTTSASQIAPYVAGRLYSSAMAASSWRDVVRDAALAETLAARLGAEGLALQYHAVVDGAAADFIETRDADGWIKLADAWDFLFARLEPPRVGQGVDLGVLEDIYWRSEAWMLAMEAYFQGGRDLMSTSMAHKRAGNSIEDRRKTRRGRCSDEPCLSRLSADGTALQCAASWVQEPKLRYPQRALFRGMLGATILRLTTDDRGAVTEVDVLASVPGDVFPDAATRTISQWKLKSLAPPDAECSLSGERELRVVFQLL